MDEEILVLNYIIVESTLKEILRLNSNLNKELSLDSQIDLEDS